MSRRLAHRLARRAGYDLIRYPPPDFSPEDVALIREVGPYKLATRERCTSSRGSFPAVC